MLKSLILLSSILFSQYIYADQASEKITSMDIVTLNRVSNSLQLPAVQSNPIDEIAIIIDSMIALGKKIWPIIEAGRPVITNGLAPVISVLPKLDDNSGVLYKMANWSAPTAQSYRLSYKNIYGKEVIGFTYTIYFQHDGSLNGVGKYITSLAVQASDIHAAWGGFKFDVTSELISIANVGSESAPVASAIIRVNCKAKSVLNEDQSSISFYVDGTGILKNLN
jgi:hypothetical protein